MSQPQPLGPIVQSFFEDHPITIRGLRPASVHSYRDTIRLLLLFIAADKRCKLTRLTLEDLTFERITGFLRYLEHDRGNHARTRNQRLAAIHNLFEYIATRSPEMLATCQRVAAIPTKRVAPPETRFLERDETQRLLASLPSTGRLALRDRALILFLYNTGARVQEAAAMRVEQPFTAPTRTASRQGRQMADLPTLATNRANTPAAARHARPAAHASHGGVHRQRPAAHPVRDLQDRAPTRGQPRRPAHRPTHQPAHVPPHRGHAPARGRQRSQRHPRMARPHRPDHHQPLRRDQHQNQTTSTAGHRTPGHFGGTPHHANLAIRRNAPELARVALTNMWPRSIPPNPIPP
jgi:Phage integrase, N-terminal SAM-like domain